MTSWRCPKGGYEFRWIIATLYASLQVKVQVLFFRVLVQDWLPYKGKGKQACLQKEELISDKRTTIALTADSWAGRGHVVSCSVKSKLTFTEKLNAQKVWHLLLILYIWLWCGTSAACGSQVPSYDLLTENHGLRSQNETIIWLINDMDTYFLDMGK